MSHVPFVSILIPCCNAERWVGQAVESALGQTHARKEVIVVDDGSTDGSLEVLRSFGDAIQVEAGPHRGRNAARNQLLALSRGEWIQYLDADDYLRPDKIEQQMQLIAERPGLDVVYSPLILRTESTGREASTWLAEKQDVFANYLSWCAFQTASVLVRRAAIDAVGRWNVSQKLCQEHELLSRLLMNGCQFAVCDHAGAVHRFHGDNTVSAKSPEATIRERMLLTDRVANYLEATGQLTAPRRTAIARSRFECARSMYFVDRKFARGLMHLARGGVPIPPSPAGPRSYRVALSVQGFDLAERIARLRRGVVRPGATRSHARR